jgi:hypothetical protein
MDLTEDNFFDHLLDPDRRRMLAEAPRAEEGTHLPLNRRYGDLASAATDADRLFLDPSRNWTADASTQAPGAPDRVDRPDTGNR